MSPKILLYLSLFVLIACKNPTNKNIDAPNRGSIQISVDESFRPVFESERKVFSSSFPDATIDITYKSESECFKDFQKDSTRLIVVARGLSSDEEKYYKSTLGYAPTYDLIAYDAVAVLVNQESKDSVFTIQQLKNILSGKNKTTAIMDGKNATSTVRYLKDSLLKGANFGNNVVAANGSEDVINQISNHKEAIGFIGLSWVSNLDEKTQIEKLKNIRLGLVECVQCTEKDMFAKPSQATISYAQYPLARPLYYILKENYAGLGTGFINFLSLERGQLIFKRAGLVCAKMNFTKRTSKIQEKE